MPSQPPIRRSNPPQKSIYTEYKEELRSDFFNSCAYCCIMERESAGVGFSIDHYIPKETSQGKPLENKFLNLLLSCDDCNSYKGMYLANATQTNLGHVIIRPDEMVPSDHFMLDETDPCELASKTTTGQFNIAKLDLNRPGLQRIRAIRHQCYQAKEIIEQGIKALSSVALDNLEPSQKARLLKIRHDILQIKSGFDGDIEPRMIVKEIKDLENGVPLTHGTKPPSQFQNEPLKGLWHKHFFSGQFVGKNMVNEWVGAVCANSLKRFSTPRNRLLLLVKW